jgi:UDPglucose 6-dehydrogenase
MDRALTRAHELINVTVIGGAGYVGFITGLGLAELGHRVVGVDIAADKVEMLRSGRSPIYEEGVDLNKVLRRNLEAGRIAFTTDLAEGVRHGEVIFIAVGTPESEGGQADLSQVISVAENFLDYIDSYKVIVVKSTVPVGTVELVCDILKRRLREGEDFDIVANPEFLREGRGLYDFFNPTRIVIGARSDRARKLMRNLYAPFLEQRTTNGEPQTTNYTPRTDTPLIETDIASAQMIKYASNAFLATRISFINEIASICERVGADVKEVAEGMGYDPRIGHEYLEAGIGFGGPCLEKDLKALIRIAENSGYEPRFLRAVLEKNEYQVRQVIAKLKELAGYLLYRKIITIFGLAFKAGTNDVRTSLSLRVIDQLEKEGAIVRAYDPIAIPEARKVKSNIEYYDDPYEAVRYAEALLILTEWPQFRELDWTQIKEMVSSPNIIDGKNLLEPERMRELGFIYRGIGRQG